MDERNRLLNDAYRDYNDSLSFMLQSLSNIMRTHSDTQMAYNNNIRSLISILQSTSFNMERNNNAIIENIRSSYSRTINNRGTVSRNTEPVFNNNNRATLFRTRNPLRGGHTIITPSTPTRLRLSRDFYPDANNNNGFDTLAEMMNNINVHFQSSVAVYPSQGQIQSATRCYNYTANELEEDPDLRCPITHEEFELNEEVCIIKHCNHKFKKEPLYQWFNSNVRCPVCRFDIREYREQQDNDNDNDNDISFNMDLSSVSTLGDALRDAIIREGDSNIVSLELPIPINRTNSGPLSDFFRDLSNNVI